MRDVIRAKGRRMHELMQVRSARVEALPQLSVCLSLGIAVVSFDFSGSGLSEGL
jgi:hypothetical protein